MKAMFPQPSNNPLHLPAGDWVVHKVTSWFSPAAGERDRYADLTKMFSAE